MNGGRNRLDGPNQLGATNYRLYAPSQADYILRKYQYHYSHMRIGLSLTISATRLQRKGEGGQP